MTDYLREYKGYCLTCKNYDLERKSDATTRGFRCTYHGRPMAMDEKCPHYSKDIVRSNSFIDSQVRWMNRHGYDPRRDKDTFCYITTMCCDILGLSDNHKYLESLRKLRSYLITFDFGKKILLDYDVYGVLVSKKIYEDYCQILDTWKPDALSIERLYFTNNQKTGIDVAQARGIIIMAAAQRGIEINEYTPLQVKQAVVGYGQAVKKQVQEMTKNILKLPFVPKPDDTADALAMTICHAQTSGSLLRNIKASNI